MIIVFKPKQIRNLCKLKWGICVAGIWNGFCFKTNVYLCKEMEQPIYYKEVNDGSKRQAQI